MNYTRFVALSATSALLAISLAVQAKPGGGGGRPNQGGTPDLTGRSFTLKTKTRGTSTTVNNATVIIANEGDGDSSNTRVQYYLSDDAVYTTDPLLGTPDSLFHTVSLGKVKANKTKKRTIGGGLFKNLSPSGKFIIAVIDPDNIITESNETNNTVVSPQLP